MRLLLDTTVSTDGVGRQLAAAGHDVGALDQEPALDGLSDEEVLELAAKDRSILITLNVVDFPPILREWLSAGRSHAGVIIVHGIAPPEAAQTLAAVETQLARRPRHVDWVDHAVVATIA